VGCSNSMPIFYVSFIPDGSCTRCIRNRFVFYIVLAFVHTVVYVAFFHVFGHLLLKVLTRFRKTGVCQNNENPIASLYRKFRLLLGAGAYGQ
jgi:hypothetical protein